ncbi:MAG: 16S rRNA (adenine(1518)-N(6)/adenine(1519)-N(6))-dimethyltransferase RsmA [Actinomycetota bacterium]|nr:MAG: 16S rRNA (adenine(1518)-N(6)/adenine(1519)-N(6))-dimethyltransferase RsmA [Actinomycetota bacterium]
MTLSRREATELLARHGLAPSRALGQNFVVDPNTVRRMVRLAGVGPNDHVVEVGAGLGALTLAIAETGATVRALELDRGLVRVLAEVLADNPNASVVEADAMNADWTGILLGAPSWMLVANLPYNIATPLVADLLDKVPAIEKMVVMVQREVGERLAAGPGDPAYGAVSVKVSYWAKARLLGDVPPTVFMPRPKVMSTIVEITRRPAPAVDAGVDRQLVFALVRAGFGHRRKMLRRSLAGLVTAEHFAAADVRPEARAEELDVADWGRLTAVVQADRQ